MNRRGAACAAILAFAGACDRSAPPADRESFDAALGSNGIARSAPASPLDAGDPLARVIEMAGIDEPRLTTPTFHDEATRILGAPVEGCGILRPCDFEILALSDDPRASQALVALLGRPRYIARGFLIQAMARHPRPEYLRAIEVLLDDPGLTAAPASEGMVYGLMHSALVRSARRDRTALATAQVDVLSYATMVGNQDSLALLRRLATDQRRSSPDPRALATLTCGPRRRNEREAMAIASVRLVAMAWLGDRGLASKTALDSGEPEFVRQWAEVMARSPRGPGPRPTSEIQPVLGEGAPPSSPSVTTPPTTDGVSAPCH